MKHNRTTKKKFALPIGLLLAAALALTGVFSTGAMARTQAQARVANTKPTIVLVHGAWATAGSWDSVAARLQAAGYTVYTPPNPLLNLQTDSATIRDFLKTIKGPIVLVGHSYGGAVITNAADGVPNVKALVYIDAFAPAQGESVFQLDAKFPGSVLMSAPLSKVFRQVSYPGAPKGSKLFYVNEPYFKEGFATDLSAKQEKVAYSTQAPEALAGLNGKSGPPAWTHIPSWYQVGTADGAIPPAAQMFMAKRMHAHINNVNSNHLPMVSHPAAVTKTITKAAQSIG